MPAHSDDGLTEKSIDVLFRAALEVVADNFNAAEHLPKPVYDFLLPVATSSCQGLYATAMLFLGSMPALANGASVRLWTQKPSPLALMVLHMAPAQRGKSRLYQAVELLFEAADDVVEDLAKVEAHKVGQSLAVEGVAGQPPADVPVQTKSICLQSFTMTEFFYRCSAEFPQVELHQGATKKEKAAKRLWFGQAFNLDEAYEFLENLSLLGSRSEKAKDSSVNAHASTLNTLLARGKTKRATRTSTSFEASRTQHVSLSVLGNGHPTKLIAKAWDWYEPLMFSRCLVGPMRVDVGTNSLTSNNSITLVHVGPSRSKCPFTTACVFKMAFLTVASPHSPHGQIHNLCQLGSHVRLCRFGVRQ